MAHVAARPSLSPNVQLVQQFDQKNERIADLDSAHSDPVAVDIVHHMIHAEAHFTVAVVDTDVDIAGPKYVRITAPDTTVRIHFVGVVSADAACTVEFYENPTINAGGNALTEYNNDRNSAELATATTFEDTTTNVDGTLLFASRIGGTGRAQTRISGEISTRQEWILDQDGDYLVKVTADADNTTVIIVLTWYEV